MVTQGKWLIDCSATNHMTRTHFLFSHLDKHDRSPPIWIGDGSPSPVCGTGMVHATTYLQLEDTLYVLTFPCNFLFITSLYKQLYCSIMFTSTTCSFQDPRSKETIVIWTENGGFYFLIMSLHSQLLLSPTLFFSGIFASVILLLTSSTSLCQNCYRMTLPSIVKIAS